MLRTRICELLGMEHPIVLMGAGLRAAAKAGDPDRGAIMLGQPAGLIGRVEPAADLVRQIRRDAEAIPRERLPRLLA